ncbi:MAG: hypothetical protein JWQ71_4648 [Pedosphaera sp.]|nr:hypothetical protein [Pedosphaera sp.]
MIPRFTLDGSEALEAQLAEMCRRVLSGVQSLIPAPELEALVLGGGYGRGQGGVFKTVSDDRPYNDLEFYVFVRGNILLSERKYRRPLHELGERLSPDAGLHVEFKVYSVEKLRTSAISMFTYDLVAGHRTIFGEEKIFDDCAHHLVADQIPLHEATRLLFNRCSGLLLAKDFLRLDTLTADQTDFIGRNLAKAQLALGDAVLTVFGQYHWSCTERHHRLNKLAVPETLPWLAEVRQYHAAGVDFKLHPRTVKMTKAEFEKRHAEVSGLGHRLWLWAEGRRLQHPFTSAREYALSSLDKCAETARWRNFLLNLKTFGFGGAFGNQATRYPRERLFHALVLLLWDNQSLNESILKKRLQDQLRTNSTSWTDFVAAYKPIWENFG